MSISQNKLSPQYSFLIITFRGVNYVADCLNRIIEAMKGTSFEIIVADRGSDDGTKEALESYSRKYPNIILIMPVYDCKRKTMYK